MGVLFSVDRDNDLPGDERLQSRLIGAVDQKVVVSLLHGLPIHGFGNHYMMVMHPRVSLPRDGLIAQRDEIALKPRFLERLTLCIVTFRTSPIYRMARTKSSTLNSRTMRVPIKGPVNIHLVRGEPHVIRKLHLEMQVAPRTNCLALFGTHQVDYRLLVIHLLFLARREYRAAQYH